METTGQGKLNHHGQEELSFLSPHVRDGDRPGSRRLQLRRRRLLGGQRYAHAWRDQLILECINQLLIGGG